MKSKLQIVVAWVLILTGIILSNFVAMFACFGLAFLLRTTVDESKYGRWMEGGLLTDKRTGFAAVVYLLVLALFVSRNPRFFLNDMSSGVFAFIVVLPYIIREFIKDMLLVLRVSDLNS